VPGGLSHSCASFGNLNAARTHQHPFAALLMLNEPQTLSARQLALQSMNAITTSGTTDRSVDVNASCCDRREDSELGIAVAVAHRSDEISTAMISTAAKLVETSDALPGVGGPLQHPSESRRGLSANLKSSPIPLVRWDHSLIF